MKRHIDAFYMSEVIRAASEQLDYEYECRIRHPYPYPEEFKIKLEITLKAVLDMLEHSWEADG